MLQVSSGLDVRLWPKVGQIGTKWGKSVTISGQMLTEPKCHIYYTAPNPEPMTINNIIGQITQHVEPK